MTHKNTFAENVAFESEKLGLAFRKLATGKQSNHQLHKSIVKIIEKLSMNPRAGDKIRKQQIPKSLVKKYNLDNLYKHNLVGGWRLLYTIKNDTVHLLVVVLIWINHKSYEKIFRYAVKDAEHFEPEKCSLNLHLFDTYPTLEEVLMVKHSIEEHDAEGTMSELWERKCSLLPYEKYCTIVDHLILENNVCIDGAGKICILEFSPPHPGTVPVHLYL